MMTEATVKIKFTGSGAIRRSIGDTVWEAANDHTADVGLEMAAELLTSPEDDWVLAETPKPAVLRKLAESMGLAPAELINVDAETESAPVAVNEAPDEPAEGVK